MRKQMKIVFWNPSYNFLKGNTYKIPFQFRVKYLLRNSFIELRMVQIDANVLFISKKIIHVGGSTYKSAWGH